MDPKYCHECGLPLVRGAKFCSQCAMPVGVPQHPSEVLEGFTSAVEPPNPSEEGRPSDEADDPVSWLVVVRTTDGRLVNESVPVPDGAGGFRADLYRVDTDGWWYFLPSPVEVCDGLTVGFWEGQLVTVTVVALDPRDFERICAGSGLDAASLGSLTLLPGQFDWVWKWSRKYPKDGQHGGFPFAPGSRGALLIDEVLASTAPE